MSVAKPAPSLRWLAPGLLIAGLMLIGVDLARPHVAASVKTAVIDGVAPIFSALANPSQTVGNWLDAGYGMVAIYQENQRLQAENDRLRAWYIVAQRLSAENRQLQELVNHQGSWSEPVLSSRVIADTGGAFARSVLLDHGLDHGVVRGMAAMTAQGVVGRVQTAGQHSARLLLLTDINSRVPAMLEKNGERLVVAGNNQARPELQYLRDDVPVTVGDVIVTSGIGGIFPRGLPLGSIAAIETDSEGRPNRIVMQPSVDFARLGMVSLLPPVVIEEPIVTVDEGIEAAAADRENRADGEAAAVDE